MKQLKFFFAFLLIISLIGCFDDINDNTPIEYFAYGIYHFDTKNITTDDHENLIVRNASDISYTEDTRVFVCFFVDKFEDDFTIEVTVTRIFDISVPLIHLDEENRGLYETNYAIDYIFMWVRQDYLTVIFNFWRENERSVHNFSFLMDPEEQEEGKINLTFHHAANSAFAYSHIEKWVSTSIKELKDLYPAKDSVELVISFPRVSTPGNPDRVEKHSIWYVY